MLDGCFDILVEAVLLGTGVGLPEIVVTKYALLRVLRCAALVFAGPRKFHSPTGELEFARAIDPHV